MSKISVTGAPPTIGAQIKIRLVEMGQVDGLKRTQRWLAGQTLISEVELSNKISGNNTFDQEDLDKINVVLGTKFKCG